MSLKKFHFTIGPVQGFVTQSRRIRDLLASSFLLSFLSGQAMVEVDRQGGRLLFPEIGNQEKGFRDPLFRAIQAERAGEEWVKGPWIGSLPNRFTAEVPEDFLPDSCVKAVKKAWKRVADAVWERWVKQVAPLGTNTESIWKRQVSSFWETAWVLGEGTDLLDRRKNWRNHIPSLEEGDKCMLIGTLQEISGHLRGGAQREFWSELRESVSTHSWQLGENERLSAIALIKRLYPLVAKEAIGWPFPREAVGFPSTAYLAALPWITKAVTEQPSLAASFLEAAAACRIPPTENGAHFGSVQKLKPDGENLRAMFRLDGPCFFESNLQEGSLYWKGSQSSCERRKDLWEARKRLVKKIGEPSPFYALLLMDGDRLGALLQSGAVDGVDPGVRVSRALSAFIDGLPPLISEHDGVTIYAGGDDVLAMFPLHGALPSAVRLREKYMKAFAGEEGEGFSATLSAAIVYAHYRAPLKGVLQHAHHLLDDVAKESCGRDSLAVGVWKSGGPTLTWSAPWDTFCKRPDQPTQLEFEVGQSGGNDEALFSRSFLYKLRQFERIGQFSGGPGENRNILIDLAAAEYLRGTGSIDGGIERAKEEVTPLIDLCLRSWRDDTGKLHQSEGPFRADGALLAGFLAQKGGESS